MQGLIEFASDSRVHDTVLMTMVITSLLSAAPKPGTITVSNTKEALALLYKFVYDWVTSFWSMKTGQQPKPPTDPTSPVPRPATPSTGD